MVRILIIILWLPVMVWAFIARLLSEVRSAFWFAWNDVRIEHDAMRARWQKKHFDPEDWS